MVRGGRLFTPPGTDNILEGITRSSLIDLAGAEMKLDVVERSIDRSELYLCDELFFSGTAVEIAPIVRIDHRPVGTGRIGPVTERLRALFTDLTRGRMPSYGDWLWPVYRTSVAGKAA
jgi:branched-chain amino acid aminotransferase